MGKLTDADRKRLSKSDFGEPDKDAYPMPDKAHARLAKSGASHAERVGNISRTTEERIDAKADRVLGESGGKTKREREGKTRFAPSDAPKMPGQVKMGKRARKAWE